mgnify:CR=1 FL=1
MADAIINLKAVDKTKSAFSSVNRNMQSLSKSTQGVQSQIMGAGFGLMGAGTIFDLVRLEITETIKTIDDIPGVPEETVRSIENMNILFNDARMGVRSFIASAISGFADLAAGLGTAAGAIVFGTEAAADALDKMDAAAKAGVDKRAFDKLEKTLVPLRKSLKATEDAANKAMAPLSGVTLKGREQLEALRAQYGGLLHELTKFEGIDTEKALTKKIELNKELALIATKLHAAELKALQAQKEAAKILGQGFEKAIVNGEKLSDVLKQVAKDLMQLAIRNAITNPLIEALGGSSILGGLFGGFRASGGPVSGGRSYVVGERGPELFTPSGSGAITSNSNMGGGSTYYIDARGADRSGLARLEQMIQQTQASIQPIALQSVVGAAARGII